MKYVLAAALCALALALAGCGPVPEPIEQTVSGVLKSDSVATGGLGVKMVSANAHCDAAGVEAAVEPDGKFSFKRTVFIRKLVDVVQNDTLCIGGHGNWLPAWHYVYGPAPRSLTFHCAFAGSAWSCLAAGYPAQASRQGR